MFQKVLYSSGQDPVEFMHKFRALLSAVLQDIVCEIQHAKLLRYCHLDKLGLPDRDNLA